MKISRIKGREIFNAAGLPTIECEIVLDNKILIKSSVPSGVNQSPYEALELFDGGTRFMGRGMNNSVEKIEQYLSPRFIGRVPNGIEMDQEIITIDGTPDKSRLGTNATLALSMAIYRAQAVVEELELYELIAHSLGAQTVSFPVPMMHCFHEGINSLAFAGYMIVPLQASSFRTAFEQSAIFYHELDQLLKQKNIASGMYRNGHFGTSIADEQKLLDFLLATIQLVKDKYAIDVVIALDVGADSFYNPRTKHYQVAKEELSTQDMLSWYKELIKNNPIYCIIDPFAVDDREGWQHMYQFFHEHLQIVGDALFATQSERIVLGAQEQWATACVIKPSQVGTVSQALQAIATGNQIGLQPIVSYKPHDTTDAFIADLALGASINQIIFGAPHGGEHIEKYNRMLTLEDDLTALILKAA